MGKTLPILGIVGAVSAALSIAVLVPDSLAMFAPLVVGLAGSIVLVGQRTIVGAVAGLLVLVLTVVAGLGLVGTVSTEDGGETDFGIAPSTGQVLLVAACLLLPVGAVALRWEEAEPRWLTVGGAACAAIAFLLVASDPDGIGDQSQTMTLVAAVLALLGIGAMVPLVRAPADESPAPERRVAADTPLASSESSVPAHKAPAKPPSRRP